MRNYIIRRLLLAIPVLIITSFIIFFMQRLIPGDIVDLMLEQSAGLTAVHIDRATLEHSLGLDVPLFTQYGRWMGFLPQEDGIISGILEGNLGNSLYSKVPISESVGVRLPVTFELGLLALIISQIIALPIGMYSAIRQDTWGDYIARSFSILCMAVPGFWLGTMIIVFPSIWWNYTPPIMLIKFTEDPIGNLKMFIVPAFLLGMLMAGGTMRMTRSMMLEVLRQDYVRTAWAKGLKERIIVTRHAMKNALIPVVTIIGGQLPIMIGGTVIIEQIFCLPGMGQLGINATINRDYPIVSALLFISGIVILLSNILVDIIYAYLDPRVSYK